MLTSSLTELPKCKRRSERVDDKIYPRSEVLSTDLSNPLTVFLHGKRLWWTANVLAI